ncbi:hypothetical protein B5X24_HaOG201015 [Helicoverpa armigera]|nr:hypothetical protein B5X24_HaOG201015 [Helicoverpa armigera]
MLSHLNKFWKPNKSATTLEHGTRESTENEPNSFVIEDDLQSILKPLNLMLGYFFCSKYSIRDKLITYNSYIYEYIRVLVVIIIYSWNFYNTILLNKKMLDQHWHGLICLGLGSMSGFFLSLIGDTIITWSNIIQKQCNILLVIKIQQILRVLQIYGNELRNVINWSWICVIVLNIFSMSYFICYCVTIEEINVIGIIISFASVTYDINVVFAFLLLKLCEKILRVWLEKIKLLKDNGDEASDEFWNRMLKVYLSLLDIYLMIESTFKHMASIS